MKKFYSFLGLLLGTIAGLLAFGILRFRRDAKDDATRMFDRRVRDYPEAITEEMLKDLPEVVQRYLRYSKVVGKPQVRVVRLKQKGRIRQDETQPWMPITAEEYYTVEPPAFVWLAGAQAGPLPLVTVEDSYLEGRGRMEIKFGGLADMGDYAGPEMDQGALMRFLNELIWFPAAFLNDYISWEAIDDNSARVTLDYGGQSVSAVVEFTDQGRLRNFTAERYRTEESGYRLVKWSTPVTAYGTFEGMRIPVLGRGVWHLESGDLTYIELQITDLQINSPHLY